MGVFAQPNGIRRPATSSYTLPGQYTLGRLKGLNDMLRGITPFGGNRPRLQNGQSVVPKYRTPSQVLQGQQYSPETNMTAAGARQNAQDTFAPEWDQRMRNMQAMKIAPADIAAAGDGTGLGRAEETAGAWSHHDGGCQDRVS